MIERERVIEIARETEREGRKIKLGIFFVYLNQEWAKVFE